MLTLKSLLKNVENNNFDFSRYYELDGTSLTLKQYLNRQEHLVWSEIEKLVNQYTTTVSRQLNNIGILEGLLSRPITTNQVTTVLRDTKDEGIIHAIEAVINHIPAYSGEMVLDHINQNLMWNLSRNIENLWFRSNPVLQYRTPQTSASFTGSKPEAGATGRKNAGVMNLISRLSNFINVKRHETRTFVDEKYHHMYGEQKILYGSLLSGGLIRHQLPVHTSPAEEVPHEALKTPFLLFSQQPLPVMMEEYAEKVEQDVYKRQTY